MDGENAVSYILSPALRLRYEADLSAIRDTFELSTRHIDAGEVAVRARSDVVDHLIESVLAELQAAGFPFLAGTALIAVGGYGRRELFPFSDVDLLFLAGSGIPGEAVKEPVALLRRALWDVGLRVNLMIRTYADCERFDPENVEFTLSLFDSRYLAGDLGLALSLTEDVVEHLIATATESITSRLLTVTRNRHARFGNTLFHLEPDIKQCAGGLRDAHVCQWFARLSPRYSKQLQHERDFIDARRFLALTRTFLHLRHGRDDNTLEWRAQDAAAAVCLGIGEGPDLSAAAWMRQYFRHARVIDSCLRHLTDEASMPASGTFSALGTSGTAGKAGQSGSFAIRASSSASKNEDKAPAPHPAAVQSGDPEKILSLFVDMAANGGWLSRELETGIQQNLHILSDRLEDGPKLWHRLKAILLGPRAGEALRVMHALGVLELVVPEFHAIDALVIRDAYHRYTVDEHTFVVIDTLHGLESLQDALHGASSPSSSSWSGRFAQLFRDLAHPELLLLASLLHDTGKGHVATQHAKRSAELAEKVAERLALDRYETALVVNLIRNHLEMSNTLRRDVSSQETIRAFASVAPDPESLRMLTLFTYADIAAVNPDALTPWKAENLWRLYNATSAWLERTVDEERIAETDSLLNELSMRVHALLPKSRLLVNAYLEGFPRRYLQTRAPEVIRNHFKMAKGLAPENGQLALDFQYAPQQSELTLISRDRPRLFSSLAGALAAWGMNIASAEAFSNAQGVIVDTFRFSDIFRTLELNESERDVFTSSVREIMNGTVNLDALLASRRRAPRRAQKIKVDTFIRFDDTASTHSTLLQVVAQDTPGLLHALSLTIAQHDCSIEVALIDTEGEAAIDVFYLTHAGLPLASRRQQALTQSLQEAIALYDR